MAPMFAFRTAIAVLFGALFLGEILTTNQYILVLMIFIAGIFVNLDEQFKLKSFFNRWVAVLLACMFFLVLQAVFVKKSVPINGLWNTTFWMALLGQLWLLGTIKFFKNDIVSTTKKQYGSMVILALIGIVVVITENTAYAGNVSISAVIISLPISMVLAFLLSRLMPELLEKHTLKIYAIRLIAAAVMITAALKL